MRKRLHGRSLRLMFLGGLLLAAVVSCEQGVNDPEGRATEQTEVDSAELAQSPAAAAIRPGERLNRQQLVQLLGDRVPAAANEACTALGQVCAAQSFAPKTSCNYTDTCDTDATQTGVFVDFLCEAVNGNATCTAIAQQNTVTVSCNRVTNGLTCVNARCDAPFCLAYSGTCTEQTTQMQNCFSAAVCSSGVCGGQTMTQSAVGTCQRDTDGDRCTKSCSGKNAIPQCSSGACQCLSGQP